MTLINKLDEDKQKATLEIRDSRTMLRTLVFLDFDVIENFPALKNYFLFRRYIEPFCLVNNVTNEMTDCSSLGEDVQRGQNPHLQAYTSCLCATIFYLTIYMFFRCIFGALLLLTQTQIWETVHFWTHVDI
jgi:hypothetical protein